MAAVEGALAIATGRLVDLSVQQVIDCSRRLGNMGCKGGYTSTTFDYMKKNDLMTWSAYPFTGELGNCEFSKSKGVASVEDYVQIPRYDANALLEAVAEQPVYVGIDASSKILQLYKEGIIDSPSCGSRINHAVTIVGYGTENGKDYWLIKNSWGTWWGDSGFFKVIRSRGGRDSGVCALYQDMAYPIVKKGKK